MYGINLNYNFFKAFKVEWSSIRQSIPMDGAELRQVALERTMIDDMHYPVGRGCLHIVMFL